MEDIINLFNIPKTTKLLIKQISNNSKISKRMAKFKLPDIINPMWTN